MNVNSLGLDKRSEEKFIMLAEHRFNPRSGVVTIVADKCPYRRQNEDYANYLLTTLYYESQVTLSIRGFCQFWIFNKKYKIYYFDFRMSKTGKMK